MILNIKELTGAVAKVSAFASGEKNVPGVLLDIREDELRVCYTDSRVAIVESIGVELEEGEIPNRLVVNYQRLVEVLAVCQPSGRIITERVAIRIEGDKTLRVIAEKKMEEVEADSDEVTFRTVSVASQTLGYDNLDVEPIPMKYGVLARMDYGSIFEADNSDTWDVGVLRGILDNLSSEKGRTVYVSPKMATAFVSNTAYMSTIPVDEGSYTYPIVISTSVAKSLYDILGKTDADVVKVHHQGEKHACIHTEDDKVGIWFAMSVADKMHVATLSKYNGKAYKNYQVTLIREVLKNVVDSAVSSDKADKTVLKFKKNDDGDMVLKIDSLNAGASINNTYSVVCAGCIDKVGDIEKFELPVSLKLLGEILSKCSEDYVAIDVDVDENNTVNIRVADVSMEMRAEEEQSIRKELGEGVEIPVEGLLDMRVKTLLTKHYTMSRM